MDAARRQTRRGSADNHVLRSHRPLGLWPRGGSTPSLGTRSPSAFDHLSGAEPYFHTTHTSCNAVIHQSDRSYCGNPMTCHSDESTGDRCIPKLTAVEITARSVQIAHLVGTHIEAMRDLGWTERAIIDREKLVFSEPGTIISQLIR